MKRGSARAFNELTRSQTSDRIVSEDSRKNVWKVLIVPEAQAEAGTKVWVVVDC
jgi:hypothetical protein